MNDDLKVYLPTKYLFFTFGKNDFEESYSSIN